MKLLFQRERMRMDAVSTDIPVDYDAVISDLVINIDSVK